VLAPTLLLARSAVPVVAVRTVLGGACGDSFFRVWAEELVTITRLTEVHGLRMGDGPYTIAIATIDLS